MRVRILLVFGSYMACIYKKYRIETLKKYIFKLFDMKLVVIIFVSTFLNIY